MGIFLPCVILDRAILLRVWTFRVKWEGLGFGVGKFFQISLVYWVELGFGEKQFQFVLFNENPDLYRWSSVHGSWDSISTAVYSVSPRTSTQVMTYKD